MNFWSYKFKRKNCQLLQPQDSLRLEKYLLRYHWSGRRRRRPRHEACRSSILPLFIYPGTFIKSTCNYGLHVLRGRVLSLRLPVISIFVPSPRRNVVVANGLYDTAVRCRVGSCVVTERLRGRFFSSDSLWLLSQNSEFDELFLYLF